MITIKVNVKDGASPALSNLIDGLDGSKVAFHNEAGGRAANNAAIKYHREYQSKEGWRGPRYLAGPGRDSGNFGQNIVLGWNFQSANKAGATIANNADYYAFKVKGGVITPKRASDLTIPMVADAVGRRVKDYESITGNRLFRVAGKKALFENSPDNGFRAVYALVKSVTIKPNPLDLPDEQWIGESFKQAWLMSLSDDL